MPAAEEAPMRAQVIVTLKPSVLDPQGEAVQHALGSLGYDGVRSVRVGKLIEIDLDDGDPAEAEKRLGEMADQLLANPVIERYAVKVLKDSDG
jgi:phosphoribosylformylglycinamidine synthase PurS subunit